MIDIDTALQFAIESVLVELRRPETESVLDPICMRYQIADEDRAVIEHHIHALSAFVKLFGHYRMAVEDEPQTRRAIVAETVQALRELQAQRHRLGEVTERLAQTRPLPALPAHEAPDAEAKRSR